MATQTTNYGLKKPAYSDTADIGVINSNMDIIDVKMKEIEDKAGSGSGSGNTDTYGHVKVGSVTIDASGDDTIELVAGSNVTLTPNTTGKSVTISTTSGGGGTSITVDSELSTTSENPVQNKVVTQALNGKGTYSKPIGGIPKTDLANEVQTSLGKADTALQEHQDISGKADNTEVTALYNSISDAWNSETVYAVGQYCIHNNMLWKCLVANTNTEPAEGTYWTQTTIDAEITSVNSSLNDISVSLSNFKSFGEMTSESQSANLANALAHIITKYAPNSGTTTLFGVLYCADGTFYVNSYADVNKNGFGFATKYGNSTQAYSFAVDNGNTATLTLLTS